MTLAGQLKPTAEKSRNIVAGNNKHHQWWKCNKYYRL